MNNDGICGNAQFQLKGVFSGSRKGLEFGADGRLHVELKLGLLFICECFPFQSKRSATLKEQLLSNTSTTRQPCCHSDLERLKPLRSATLRTNGCRKGSLQLLQQLIYFCSPSFRFSASDTNYTHKHTHTLTHTHPAFGEIWHCGASGLI